MEKAPNYVKHYQCPGCSHGNGEDCFVKECGSLECSNHRAGTIVMSSYTYTYIMYLGLPIGFNRLGTSEAMKDNANFKIFKSYEESSWKPYDKFNVCVWKYLDDQKHTIVRGLMPRLNEPFLHIYLEDCRDKINCLEITDNDISLMD